MRRLPRPLRRRARGVGPLIAALAALIPAAAAAPPAEEAYAACLDLVQSDPGAALDRALAWRGGGAPARHCAALALFALGHAADAASELEALAEAMTDEPASLRARALGQAGQAWLEAGAPRRALAAVDRALALDPANAELYVDRAQAYAAIDGYWEAIDDLSRAIELAPDRAGTYVFRASAYRYVGSLELAADDVARALAIAPGDPVALLERGNIRRLRGDEAGARADWLAVLTDAPGTPAARAAQANLERLDVKVE